VDGWEDQYETDVLDAVLGGTATNTVRNGYNLQCSVNTEYSVR